MKEIKLTQGKVTLVDDEDFEILNKYKWHAWKGRNTYYARRKLSDINGKFAQTFIHWEVLGGRPESGYVTDHINGNGLLNIKNNLRVVTRRQNCQNKRNIMTTSQYPGVHWDKARNKWMAKIRIYGVAKNLGRFKIETDAAAAYERAVVGMAQDII